MADLSFETSVKIQAPPATIFPYVGDITRHVEWNHQPQTLTPLTDGPMRVGSQYRTVEAPASNMKFMEKVMFKVAWPLMMRMYGMESVTIAEITAIEPDRCFAWKAHLPSTKRGVLMAMKWEVELQPQNGMTTVIQRCTVMPPEGSPMASMVNIDNIRGETTGNLGRLKSLIEGRRG